MTTAFEDKLAIKELIAHYNQSLDSGDYEAWLACWADDAVFDGLGKRLAGIQAIRGFADGYEAGYRQRLHAPAIRPIMRCLNFRARISPPRTAGTTRTSFPNKPPAEACTGTEHRGRVVSPRTPPRGMLRVAPQELAALDVHGHRTLESRGASLPWVEARPCGTPQGALKPCSYREPDTSGTF